MTAIGADLGTKASPVNLASEGEQRLEAWLLLPDRDRAELLGGRIVYKAMAGIEHGAAAGNVFEQLGRLQGPPGVGGGWWLSQEVDMFLSGQGLRPDVVGWRTDKNPRPPHKVNIGSRHLGVYITPPDWVCAVLSTSTRSKDMDDGIKWQAYHEAGVSHYWLVDLSREQILVYQHGERNYEPIAVANIRDVKPLAPFEAVEFVTRRVFLLASFVKAES